MGELIYEFFMLAYLCFFLLTTKTLSQQQEPQVPCFYIFGDSLVDNGNNNGILTLARANYMPYGVDFPQGTTGRFTNGRTYVDILGTPSVPLYVTLVLLFLVRPNYSC